MARKILNRKTQFDRKKAESLLFPIAAFFKDGGLGKEEAIEALVAAYERAAKIVGDRKRKHIGDRIPYQNIIALWRRDKRFLDESGNPRILSMKGKDGFAALVRQGRGSYRIDPKTTVSVMLHYRTIRRVGKDRFSLAQLFFNGMGSKDLAFEPQASFLSDASENLGRLIMGRKNSAAVAPFWLRAESVDLSEAAIRKFRSYAFPRSIEFLEEIDDWLEAHSRKSKKTSGRKRRVGLGLFSIYSDRAETL